MAEGLGSADALRAVANSLVADSVAVLSADLVSDVPLGAVLAAHTARALQCICNCDLCDILIHTRALALSVDLTLDIPLDMVLAAGAHGASDDIDQTTAEVEMLGRGRML